MTPHTESGYVSAPRLCPPRIVGENRRWRVSRRLAVRRDVSSHDEGNNSAGHLHGEFRFSGCGEAFHRTRFHIERLAWRQIARASLVSLFRRRRGMTHEGGDGEHLHLAPCPRREDRIEPSPEMKDRNRRRDRDHEYDAGEAENRESPPGVFGLDDARESSGDPTSIAGMRS